MTSHTETLTSCRFCGPDCPVGAGYCHCGCGDKTSLAVCTKTCEGWLRGYPKRFINKHQGKIWPKIEEAHPFKIDGIYCRLIPLTKGQFTIVWESDYLSLMKWSWCVVFYPRPYKFYAVRSERNIHGNKYILSMHRYLMGLGYGDEIEVDHWNGNSLDNRRSNLRACTHQQNQFNRPKNKNNSTGFKGVRFEHNGYVAATTLNGKPIYLGRRRTAEEARELFVSEMKKLHGEFWNEN